MRYADEERAYVRFILDSTFLSYSLHRQPDDPGRRLFCLMTAGTGSLYRRQPHSVLDLQRTADHVIPSAGQ